jgi:hypothetical protein
VALNKRGMFFTLLTIVILSIFVVSFVFVQTYDSRKTVEKRVESLNDFVLALESNMERQLYSSGFRIIFIFQEEILEEGNPVSNLDEQFNELFFDGSLNGEEIGLMSDVTFDNIEKSVRGVASKINANVSLLNPNVSISQDDPWNVKISLNTTLIVEDLGGLAKWNRTGEFFAYIPISGFNDPLYVMKTNGLILNKMVRGDVSDFNGLLANSYYVNSTSAPSFLGRLQGISGGDENGVVSLVNLPKLSQQGFAVQSKSIADYIYFSNSDESDVCQISGQSEWVKLGNVNKLVFGVSC